MMMPGQQMMAPAPPIPTQLPPVMAQVLSSNPALGSSRGATGGEMLQGPGGEMMQAPVQYGAPGMAVPSYTPAPVMMYGGQEVMMAQPYVNGEGPRLPLYQPPAGLPQALQSLSYVPPPQMSYQGQQLVRGPSFVPPPIQVSSYVAQPPPAQQPVE